MQTTDSYQSVFFELSQQCFAIAVEARGARIPFVAQSVQKTKALAACVRREGIELIEPEIM